MESLGVIETMEAMNIMAKTRSKATPQLKGILPEKVKTVVITSPKIEVSVNVAGNGSNCIFPIFFACIAAFRLEVLKAFFICVASFILSGRGIAALINLSMAGILNFLFASEMRAQQSV